MKPSGSSALQSFNLLQEAKNSSGCAGDQSRLVIERRQSVFSSKVNFFCILPPFNSYYSPALSSSSSMKNSPLKQNSDPIARSMYRELLAKNSQKSLCYMIFLASSFGISLNSVGITSWVFPCPDGAVLSLLVSTIPVVVEPRLFIIDPLPLGASQF